MLHLKKVLSLYSINQLFLIQVIIDNLLLFNLYQLKFLKVFYLILLFMIVILSFLFLHLVMNYFYYLNQQFIIF